LKDKAAVGDPGGKLQVKKGSGIHGFSGNSILDLKIKKKMNESKQSQKDG